MTFLALAIGLVLGIIIGGFAAANSELLKRNRRFERELVSIQENVGGLMLTVAQHEALLKGKELVN
jgi:uncharacterized membrane-anchored protein YhcB (DUF1043 family)